MRDVPRERSPCSIDYRGYPRPSPGPQGPQQRPTRYGGWTGNSRVWTNRTDDVWQLKVGECPEQDGQPAGSRCCDPNHRQARGRRRGSCRNAPAKTAGERALGGGPSGPPPRCRLPARPLVPGDTGEREDTIIHALDRPGQLLAHRPSGPSGVPAARPRSDPDGTPACALLRLAGIVTR